MAELVHLHIEKTIPELEQMERIGLFTKEEIKKIIRKRRALEYTLRRRRKNKEDFLRYIQYELNLLTLIGKRRERLGCDFKRQEIDHAIATRINKLFKTVILRFQDDVSLWLSQIEFCERMKWHHSISGLFARMLQVHNSNPALWTMAAKWELEENNAPENARHLLQRALRHHPKSQQLWLEYFRMELIYSDIVHKRREVLGVQERKINIEENDAILSGLVASVVYKNATKAIPDVEFALSFIPICQQFEFTNKHIHEIFENVQNRHPDKEETLDALAKRPLITLKDAIKVGEQKGEKRKNITRNINERICSAYEEAVEKIQSNKMWKFYIDFCMQRLKMTKKEKKKIKLRSEILQLFQRASSVNCLDCDYYIQWTQLLQANGDEENALSVMLIAAHKWPQKVSLWKLCLTAHIGAKKDRNVISELLKEALDSVKENELYPIWQLGAQWMSLCNPSKLNQLFEQGLHSCREVSLPLKTMYLEVTALQSGVQTARDLCKRLIQLPPVSLELYRKMIQIEKSQMKPSIEWLRKWYEDAVREYGTDDVDLWLNFMKLEADHPSGNPALYGMLYWRAMKFLKAELVDEFITRATLFSTKRGLCTDLHSVM